MGHHHTGTGDTPPTLFISDAEVAELADWAMAVDTLRQAYAHPTHPDMVPPRSMARGDGFWLRGLTAISPKGVHMGCKLIAASPKARKASYLVSLFDQDTMALKALLDGNRITGIRTAATAALFVDTVAPQRPLRVAVLGSGFEATGLLSALLAVRAVARSTVFSPNPDSRRRFAAAFAASHQHQVSEAASAEAAVQDADVVLCAARSRDESPVLLGRWLPADVAVVSIGSTLPEQREVDTDVVQKADIVVADMVDEVAHDTGDMLAATRGGVAFDHKLVALTDVVSGRVRRAPGQTVLYKSVGSALQDIAAAEAIFNKAVATARGTHLAHTILPVSK